MKTNEAPEKIYVKITHPISDKYTEMIAFEHGNGIEYIRTDAFIEKACKWLEANFNMPDDFELHFRKAMEENNESK